jgi:uncharacterized protein
MTIPTDEAPVVDDTAAGRFVIREGGTEAELLYALDGDRILLVHTGVPEEWGGRGIGGRLVRAALERAEANALTVVPLRPALAARPPRRGGGGHDRLGDATSSEVRTLVQPVARSWGRRVALARPIPKGVVLEEGPGTFDGEGATK